MNEERLRELIRATSNEKIQPLMAKLVEIVSEAYKTGVALGIEIGKGLN